MITQSEYITQDFKIAVIKAYLEKISIFYQKQIGRPVHKNAVVTKEIKIGQPTGRLLCTIWVSERVRTLPFARTINVDEFIDVNRRSDFTDKLIAVVEMTFEDEWKINHCLDVNEFYPNQTEYKELKDFLIL